jgi:hypothetical protein
MPDAVKSFWPLQSASYRESRRGGMAIVGLVCILAIVFLIACLRGFGAALKQRHIVWAVLVIREGNDVVEFSRRQPQPIRFPKAA